jgi:hypothetical protein
MADTDDAQVLRYELLSMIPAAAGWTAEINSDVAVAAAVEIKPVVMWGLFHVTSVSKTGELVEDFGNRVEGIVPWHASASGVSLECAQDIGNRDAVYQLPGSD